MRHVSMVDRTVHGFSSVDEARKSSVNQGGEGGGSSAISTLSSYSRSFADCLGVGDIQCPPPSPGDKTGRTLKFRLISAGNLLWVGGGLSPNRSPGDLPRNLGAATRSGYGMQVHDDENGKREKKSQRQGARSALQSNRSSGFLGFRGPKRTPPRLGTGSGSSSPLVTSDLR
ncbi:hypothetical protein N658DRAFT_300510 [Parathielavia hyrcaniae]|uniref:Uncharacterized protein n=1 Tax=Parathielavia hyrcaniae TaxID=113614 RepID=A0AAN6Q572_9PEZI|nr:hypothetical protein N658DRAFT_300510 [Parathielavia hyrcaniae]